MKVALFYCLKCYLFWGALPQFLYGCVRHRKLLPPPLLGSSVVSLHRKNNANTSLHSPSMSHYPHLSQFCQWYSHNYMEVPPHLPGIFYVMIQLIIFKFQRTVYDMSKRMITIIKVCFPLLWDKNSHVLGSSFDTLSWEFCNKIKSQSLSFCCWELMKDVTKVRKTALH